MLDLPQMRFAAKALRVDLVDVLGAGGRAANQPLSVETLMPPNDWPLPGAAVSVARTGSPASSFIAELVRRTAPFSTVFCAGVAGASIRS